MEDVQTLATPNAQPVAATPEPEEPVTPVEEARKFARKYDPRPDVDYTWVGTYAATAWSTTNAACDLLVLKAEKLIGFTTTIAAIAAAGIIKASSEGMWPVAAACLPALFCWLGAIATALRIHAPADYPDLPGVDHALAYADYYLGDPKTAQGSFAAKIHESREALRAVTAKRCEAMNDAYRLVGIGTWLLLAPVAVGLAISGYQFFSSLIR